MTTPPAPDITQILLAWQRGDEEAPARLLPLVYSELRKIARARMRAESPGYQTIETTDLIHEAYVRLVGGAPVDWQNRAHFYAVCARLMRRILVDRARARHSKKRGGETADVTFGDSPGVVPARDEELLALDDALVRLSKSDARKGEVVTLRYFGGLTVEETAQALDLSPETVARDWRVARLWLARELRGPQTAIP